MAQKTIFIIKRMLLTWKAQGGGLQSSGRGMDAFMGIIFRGAAIVGHAVTVLAIVDIATLGIVLIAHETVIVQLAKAAPMALT